MSELYDIYDKTQTPVRPSDYIHKKSDYELTSIAVGNLLDVLLGKGIISAEDVTNMLPFLTTSIPKPNNTLTT